jgi:predicted transposase/invertase (TIGR01784 family)
MFDDDVRSYLTDEDRKEIAEEFYAKGIEKGNEQGIKQGIEQGIEQVARRLKAVKDIPLETISAATGLSVEELQALS